MLSDRVENHMGMENYFKTELLCFRAIISSLGVSF